MSLTVTTTENKLSVEEKKITIVASQIVNTVSVAPIGIQGAKGVNSSTLVTPSDANKILTNNGTITQWTDTLSDILLNGGYF